jgi:hypothetical protein
MHIGEATQGHRCTFLCEKRMKLTCKKWTLFFLWMVCVCIACRKTAATFLQQPGGIAKGKLAKIEYPNNMYDSLYYNSEGAIEKLVFHIDLPTPFSDVFTFSYEASGKISRVNYTNDTYYDYHYQNGRLSAIDHYVNGVKRDYNIYSYQGDKVTRIDQYMGTITNTSGFDLVGREDRVYNADGNLQQEVDYFFNRQTHLPERGTTVDYTQYDTGVNVTDFLSSFPYVFAQSKNNPGKITINNEIDKIVDEFNFTYSYDSFSKPVNRQFSYLQNGHLYSEMALYHYY